MARALPALVKACLNWDVKPVVGALRLSGMDDDTARAVVADSYGPGAGDDRAAQICRATLRVFRSAGVFEVPGAEETFAAHGLLSTSHG